MNPVDIAIIVLLTGIFVAIIYFIRQLSHKGQDGKQGKKKMTRQYITRKFDDLLGIRAIFVISKDSGILLYSYIAHGDEEIDLTNPEFTSGVLHALRSLGKEMGFKNQEFSRLQFGEYYIVSNSAGHHTQAVVVSRTEPSSITEDNLLLLGKAIDKKFFGNFIEKKPYYEMSEFSGAIDLIREIFDTFFIEGLNLLYDPSKTGQLSRLSKIILDHALMQYKKDNSVVLKKLFISLYGNNESNIQKKYRKEDVII
ncbi:MAG: hypothetical protein ACTSUE_14845, partial [Promethearchaeota archaeon]